MAVSQCFDLERVVLRMGLRPVGFTNLFKRRYIFVTNQIEKRTYLSIRRPHTPEMLRVLGGYILMNIRAISALLSSHVEL